MLKPKIILTKIVHRGIEVVKIDFDRNEEIIQQLRTIKDLKWSQTHRAWYAPYTEALHIEIYKRTGDLALVDFSALVRANLGPVPKNEAAVAVPVLRTKLQVKSPEQLSPASEEKIQQFKNWLRSRRYSENTIGTYMDVTVNAPRTSVRPITNLSKSKVALLDYFSYL